MLKWLGIGFLDGVPARDLNDDELEQYGGKQFLLDSGMYEEVRGKPMSKKKGFEVPADDKDDGQGE